MGLRLITRSVRAAPGSFTTIAIKTYYMHCLQESSSKNPFFYEGESCMDTDCQGNCHSERKLDLDIEQMMDFVVYRLLEENFSRHVTLLQCGRGFRNLTLRLK